MLVGTFVFFSFVFPLMFMVGHSSSTQYYYFLIISQFRLLQKCLPELSLSSFFVFITLSLTVFLLRVYARFRFQEKTTT